MKTKTLFAVLATLGLGACVSTQTYQKEQTRSAGLETARKGLEDKNAALEKQVADLQNQVNVLTQQKAALDQNLKATQDERDKLNAALDRRAR